MANTGQMKPRAEFLADLPDFDREGMKSLSRVISDPTDEKPAGSEEIITPWMQRQIDEAVAERTEDIACWAGNEGDIGIRIREEFGDKT